VGEAAGVIWDWFAILLPSWVNTKVIQQILSNFMTKKKKRKNTRQTYTGKKWFCYDNKIRNEFFVASTKNFAAATKRFVDVTINILLL